MSKSEKALTRISTLRHKNPLFFTNAYAGTKDLIQILEHETTEVYENEHSVAVVFEDNGVRRLYLFAKSVEIAAGFVLPQNENIIILEIIEQENNDNITGLFVSNGWQVYSRMVQMSYVLPDHTTFMADSHVEIAALSDTDSVYRLLYDTFDVNISHLPNKNQLSESIMNRETLVIRDEDRVIAVAIFKVTGKKTKHFFQMAADPIHKGKRVPALEFIDFEFSRSCKGTVYSLWIVPDNPVIKFHKLVGFRECGRYLSILSTGGSNIQL